MGADYYIFTEAQIHDKWELIDPLYWRHDKNQYLYLPTFHSGSRSYFNSTYHALCGCGTPCTPDKFKSFSPQTIQAIKSLYDVSNIESLQMGINWFVNIWIIDYNQFIAGIDSKEFDHNGFVSISIPKSSEDFDSNDILTAQEWVQLPPSVQEHFEYRMWDDPDGWRYHYKMIQSTIERHLDEFMTVNWLYNKPQLRMIMLMDN